MGFLKNIGLYNNITFKVCRKVQPFIYQHLYGGFGTGSCIIEPERIIGAERIYLDENVYFLHRARIECLKGGELIIGNNTSFEEGAHIIAAGDLRIGRDCVFSAYVYISDCNHGYASNVPIMQQPLKVKKTTIGDHCFVGIGAKILPGVNLGNYCVIGANSVVTHDVPEKGIVAGCPAKIIGWNER